MNYDPIERAPQYREIFQKIDKEIEESIAKRYGKEKFTGYCFLFWDEKRTTLKQKYGIDWRSPADLNPDVSFD